MRQFSPAALGMMCGVAVAFSAFGSAQKTAPGGTAAAANWVGAYTLGESAPPDLVMDYEVAVCDAEGDAYITVDGHMTEIRLKAKATQKNGKLELFFVSYGSGDMWKKGYDQGDRLLTIVRQGQGYRIEWGALQSQLKEGAKTATAKRGKADCSATPAPEKWGSAAR